MVDWAAPTSCCLSSPSSREDHRVLAVDRPGHGLADPFDYRGADLLDHERTFLRDVVDALQLPTVDVVANSMGAFLSVAFALDAPNRVSRLVLVGAPFGIARRPPLPMLPIPFPSSANRSAGTSSRTRHAQLEPEVPPGQVIVKHPERVDDLMLDVDVAHTRRNVESMLSLIACIADWRRLGYRRKLILGERWRALTTPTLLLWPNTTPSDRPRRVSLSSRRIRTFGSFVFPGQATTHGSTTQTLS